MLNIFAAATGSDSAPNQTTTTSQPSSDFNISGLVNSVLPAVQSGGYVLVILTCAVFWLSRKEVLSLVKSVVLLIDTLKDNNEEQTEVSKRQLTSLEKIADSNKTLADSNKTLAESNRILVDAVSGRASAARAEAVSKNTDGSNG